MTVLRSFIEIIEIVNNQTFGRITVLQLIAAVKRFVCFVNFSLPAFRFVFNACHHCQ